MQNTFKILENHLSTPNFNKKHLFTRKQTIKQENVVLLSPPHFLWVITSPTKSDEVFKDSEMDYWFRVFGSCNGLILAERLEGLILMNHITLKEVTIPLLLTPKNTKMLYYDCVRGLGYDSSTDDYKIVEICSYEPKNGNALRIVDVYSVKTGVWKRLNDGCYPYSGLGPETYGFEVGARYAFESGAFLNGALHWLLCSKVGYRGCIAAFDLATEVFSEIPLPKEFVRQPGSIVECFCKWGCNMPRANGVSVVGGCLSIVDNFGNGVTEVWKMKEYGVEESWIKFCIQAKYGDWHSVAALLCYVEDGELLFLTSSELPFAFDLKSGTIREVGSWGT